MLVRVPGVETLSYFQRPSGTWNLFRRRELIFPGSLGSRVGMIVLRENYSFAPLGLANRPFRTDGFRRGLHSYAAWRLDRGGLPYLSRFRRDGRRYEAVAKIDKGGSVENREFRLDVHSSHPTAYVPCYKFTAPTAGSQARIIEL